MKILGILLFGWGTLMLALSIGVGALYVLTPGGQPDWAGTAIRLALGLGAVYLGQRLYKRPGQPKGVRPDQ